MEERPLSRQKHPEFHLGSVERAWSSECLVHYTGSLPAIFTSESERPIHIGNMSRDMDHNQITTSRKVCGSTPLSDYLSGWLFLVD